MDTILPDKSVTEFPRVLVVDDDPAIDVQKSFVREGGNRVR